MRANLPLRADILLLAASLVACSNAWPKGSTFHIEGPPTFAAQVVAAIQVWAVALGPDCPFPYALEQDGHDKTIELVDPKDWTADPAFDGATNDERIAIKSSTERPILYIEHEIGHAFGLDHSSTPGVLMYWHAGTMTSEDISRARKALGCPRASSPS